MLQDPFCRDGGLMFFRNLRIKFSEIINLDCEPYGKNQCKEKEHNQPSSVLKKFKNNYPLQIYVR